MYKFLLMFITLITLAIGTFLLTQKASSFEVTIHYDQAIKKMPLTLLKSLRQYTLEERKALYKTLGFQHELSSKKVVEVLKTKKNPHIVLWFTDHFGNLSSSGTRWYQDTIFTQLLPFQATFWLTDLTAWRYFSTKDQKLRACPDYKKVIQESSIKVLKKDECPLLSDVSTTLLSLPLSTSYQILQANKFFSWLYTCNFGKVTKKASSQLIRTEPRDLYARFSLRTIGYTPSCLDYCPLTQSKNLLDFDHTQIFPFLQYLEAIYYIYEIACYAVKQKQKECTIVFLLPNKEFTYYLVPKEKEFFQTFKENLKELLTPFFARTGLKPCIYFQPFAYGEDFYDMPFKESANTVNTHI